MGICTTQYRLVIGLFNAYRIHRVCKVVSLPTVVIGVLLFMCFLLLLSGDIHVNPGPVLSKTKSLSVCHANIRSLSRSKLLAIRSSLSDIYDIVTLSETYLHAGVGDDVFKINGFHDIIRKDRDGHGGGVAMYIRDNIAYKRLYEFETPDLEALWISIQTIEGKILLCSCYRPPGKLEFWSSFDTVIDNIKQSGLYNYMFILGDLNADFGTRNGNKLIQLCNEQNFQCLVHEPTRITTHSQTVLDQVLSNAPNFISNTEVIPPVSTNDHCTVGIKIDFRIHKNEPYFREIWIYKNANFDLFRRELLDTDFNVIFENNNNNIDQICEDWSEMFLAIAKRHITNKTVLVRPNDSPWYTSRLRLMKRKLQRLFRKFKNNNSEINWENYRRARNDYQYALDEAEKQFKLSLTNSLVENKNSKSWWRTVKRVLGKGSFRSFPPMRYNDTYLTENRDKATAFNSSFLSNSNIDTSHAQLPPSINHQENLTTITASEQEVYDLLLSLDTSKATGPDGISAKLLFEAGRAIVPTLTRLFNLCLTLSKFPQMWKYANVLPLHKKGATSECCNYRPVSLLSCTSKLLERIVFKYVYNYLRDNNILTPHQSGFQPHDSTVNQLSYLYHMFCQALDLKKDVRIVFL